MQICYHMPFLLASFKIGMFLLFIRRMHTLKAFDKAHSI